MTSRFEPKVQLVGEQSPELAAVLEARGALDILPVIVVKWFLSAFVDTLPEETVLRVWDTLFCEGYVVNSEHAGGACMYV